jgi:hypothetical protein
MLPFDTPSVSASIVLVVMACVSLAISLSFRQKSRAIREFPEDVQASTFKKTFNVFSPYAEKRRIIHEHLELLILVAVYGSFVAISFAVLKVFEFGFLLAFFTLIVCLGFLLVDETLEVHKNTNVILSALRKKTSFGKGDIEVLNFLKKRFRDSAITTLWWRLHSSRRRWQCPLLCKSLSSFSLVGPA